ncbi:hypothetical protein B296_00008850 [Ensete ventricosum]|uniref:Uncharacterized protein n=1 Tax=Ensete ventricosum TaxID=4639 RepID=A0A427B9L6_ENSVE|nr:hypothetical protein B296_00008850 [Ensete ventricosum]
MASASLRHAGVGSSRVVNSFKGSSSSVEWLGREMLEMKLKDARLDADDDEITNSMFVQDTESEIIDGISAEAGQIIAATVCGRNGQPKQVFSPNSLCIYVIF